MQIHTPKFACHDTFYYLCRIKTKEMTGKTRFYILILLMLLFSSGINAQKKKKTSTATKKTFVEKTPAQQLYESMLPSTEKVLFIDSVVVDKMSFLQYLPFHGSAGKLYYTSDILKAEQQPGSALYENDFGNRRYYSELTDGDHRQLRFTFRKGNQWSKPQPLQGIDTTYQYPNFPVMAADGTTLYFGAKGKESIGGYDIFVTRLNTDENKFYKPQNYGLPYNSTANDYLLAISETDTLGWLVTDRNQPADKVCIYTFVPSSQRENYENDNLTTEQLNRFATLASIRDTWTDQIALQKARNRLSRLQSAIQQQQTNKNGIYFVINDDITYRKLDDFRSPQGRSAYMQLIELQNDLSKTEALLDRLRLEYHKASPTARNKMAQEILQQEKWVEKLEEDIHQLKKQIRNKEINHLITE